MTVDIVFLLHADYGTLAEFETFAKKVKKSLIKHPFDYNIVLLLKGYPESEVVHTDEANRILVVPNIGRDLKSYYFYTLKSKAEYLFYFNTSSILISDHFITSGIAMLTSEHFGAVSATASFGSIVNPGYFRELVKCGQLSLPIGISKYMISFIQKGLLRLIGYKPVPHLRTNAFGCSKDFLIGAVKYFGGNLNTRLASLRFESGHRGLSGYAILKNLKLVVVDKGGYAHGMENWCASKTYANGEQENLAVKDNRTDEYENSSATNKVRLYISTWIDSPSYTRPERLIKE